MFLGHEADASTLQSALDIYAKAFIAAAEDVLASPSPPANDTDGAADAAKATARELHHKLYELAQARWKWDVLRAAD